MKKSEQRKKYWQQVLSAQQHSGLSKKDFCSDQGIKVATFYYWQRRLEEVQQDNPPGFEQVYLSSKHEVELCIDGHRIQLYSPSCHTLGQLVKHLIDA